MANGYLNRSLSHRVVSSCWSPRQLLAVASPENLHFMHELWEQDKKKTDQKQRTYRSDPSGKLVHYDTSHPRTHKLTSAGDLLQEPLHTWDGSRNW